MAIVAVSISPGRITVFPWPRQNSSTATSRLPCGPARQQRAFKTIMAGMESALGAALQRLPPTVALPWIAVPPMTATASISPANALTTSACSQSRAQVTAAPTVRPPTKAATRPAIKRLLGSACSRDRTPSMIRQPTGVITRTMMPMACTHVAAADRPSAACSSLVSGVIKPATPSLGRSGGRPGLAG